DPPIFYNQKDKDTVVFEYFRRMLLNKLDNNTDHFPTERMKCGYIESRLGGKAAEDLLPYLDDTHPDRLDTVDKLIKHLTEQYGNANALADAKDEFADLKFGDLCKYQEFLNDFTRLAGKRILPQTEWKDEFMARLPAILANPLTKEKLDPKVSFSDLAKLGADMAHAMVRARRLKERERAAASGKTTTGNAAGGTGTNRGSITGSGGRPATPANPPAPRTNVDLSKLPPLTDDLMKELIAAGKCFTCREAGHTSFKCPH
ncbi:hypothetical protein V8F33_014211, partial [Rhypophila sp. PSN 637]